MHRKYNLRCKLRNLDGINPSAMPGGDEGDGKGGYLRRHMPVDCYCTQEKRSYVTASVARQNDNAMP